MYYAPQTDTNFKNFFYYLLIDLDDLMPNTFTFSSGAITYIVYICQLYPLRDLFRSSNIHPSSTICFQNNPKITSLGEN